MNNKISEKHIKEMEINVSLASIKEITNVARGYISDEYKINDKEELIVALSAIGEEILTIKEALLEIIKIYEKEIEELRNERI